MSDAKPSGENTASEQPTASEEPANKPHLSVSQIDKWMQCPRQWYFRYVMGVKTPTNAALAIGRAFHKAVEVNYVQKIESGKDLSADEMIDHFIASMNDIRENENWKVSDDAFADAKETGMRVVACQREKIATKVHPKLVEHEFRLSLGDQFAFDLLGYIDLIEEDDTIVDNKAYKNKPYQSDVDQSVQFTAYSLAFRSIFQRVEPCCRMDAVTKQKTAQAVQLVTSRTNHDLRWFVRMLEEIATAILAKTFFPCPNGWHCSDRYCDYWNMCREMIA